MDWIRGEKLGHGSFAMVSLAAPRSRNSPLPPLMAVKSCGFSLSSSLTREKLILDELRDCPEIIACFGESVSYENGEKLQNLLLEYACGGSLADKLDNSADRRLPESEVRRCTKALLKGLDYIHKLGFVHCDIKLQNILLCGDGGEVKIADFGLAKRQGEYSGFELRGTPLYMSPEMVAGGDQGPAADIWAVGCVIVELLSGSPAWHCSDLGGLLMRIGGEVPEMPCELSEEGRDFIGRIFVKDAGERWTAEMLLNHPFVCDQDFAGVKVSGATSSPRGPLDFPDWVTCSIASPEYSPENGCWFGGEMGSGAAAERLRWLVCDRSPDWCDSRDWVTIR
ncbi:hypothetical protein SASPL_152033 [Salvia splendens]|uniref:Protein kinase domain-containing protein n=1 Tax=Salvia splendens TaxID=180675 RepID=A0A8X8W2I4_SALSN|nr:mitogen-activated protein kinase kinase kinase 20-like [Salvia splendens]KAG6386856.1 hypothetical protein SASPL_152033 [Salvia splendens]